MNGSFIIRNSFINIQAVQPWKSLRCDTAHSSASPKCVRISAFIQTRNETVSCLLFIKVFTPLLGFFKTDVMGLVASTHFQFK